MHKRSTSHSLLLAPAVLLLCAASTSAIAATAQETRQQQAAAIPKCAKSLGTIAVLEPEDGVNWWSGQQLPAPSKLIKVFVNKSRCFTLVDRGAGLSAAQGERELAASGELRNRSNLGKGQMKAADYVLVPDLIASNNNAGGNAVSGLLGGLIGGNAGQIVGGLNFKKKTADVVLTVTDVRSSEQVAMAEGSAKKTDVGWGASAGLFTGNDYGAGGASGYANTEIGQVITLAYLQAYTDLVGQLGGLSGNAAASSPEQAVEMTKPGRLFANAKGTGKAVRDLDSGMLLYPTGNKDGMMWEVEDELGNKGWVSSSLVKLAR